MFGHLDPKPRLLISLTGSSIVYFLTPDWLQLSTRIIICWNVGAVSFLTLVLLMMSKATPKKMRSYARHQDESRWIILFAVVAAACSSLLAIVLMLSGSKNTFEGASLLHIILALFTIVAFWLLIHTMFALHYAHLYYQTYNDRYI
ncbi:DUF1345 domain-containing protein [Myxosarcina sp. GI1]|uniref:DUF1345 domain-containing protein n=1 Tax=Myxosarcina sp. GI1 TaxID=1541065 RepID=UPI00068F8337|nr:DUF1345 domain-containing protein [Myxosarcina sp. GI1]